MRRVVLISSPPDLREHIGWCVFVSLFTREEEKLFEVLRNRGNLGCCKLENVSRAFFALTNSEHGKVLQAVGVAVLVEQGVAFIFFEDSCKAHTASVCFQKVRGWVFLLCCIMQNAKRVREHKNGLLC